MSVVDDLTNFLFDKERQLSSKAAVVVLVILAILLVDNILGFSSSFSSDKQIEQIQKLNSIIKDTTNDSTTKAFAVNLRSEIIARKNVVVQAMSFFRGKSNNSVKHQTNIPPVNTKPTELQIKDKFWFNISASGLYFLIAIIAIPLVLFTDNKTSFFQRLATSIITASSLFFAGLFLLWACGFIPQISHSTWLWNYLINFIIQFTIIAFLINAARNKKYN